MIILSGGKFQNAQGQPIAYGSIELSLFADGMIVTDPYGQVMSNIPTIVCLDADGSIANSPEIWSSKELNPASPYKVTIYNKDGAVVNHNPIIWVFDQDPGTIVDVSNYPNSAPANPAPVVITGPPGPPGASGIGGYMLPLVNGQLPVGIITDPYGQCIGVPLN